MLNVRISAEVRTTRQLTVSSCCTDKYHKPNYENYQKLYIICVCLKYSDRNEDNSTSQNKDDSSYKCDLFCILTGSLFKKSMPAIPNILCTTDSTVPYSCCLSSPARFTSVQNARKRLIVDCRSNSKVSSAAANCLTGTKISLLKCPFIFSYS